MAAAMPREVIDNSERHGGGADEEGDRRQDKGTRMGSGEDTEGRLGRIAIAGSTMEWEGKPRVLLTNDDGPPSTESPYVYGLYRHLTQDLAWDVKVVLPSSQKSWIGKAHQISGKIKGMYYYPKEPDGFGETSPISRPLKAGEVAEWILLDGTPASCANIAVHNIHPGQIDLLISGPNLGRNSSSAFALSSGTIGAAMSSSLSGIRSIAISYGTVFYPTPETLFNPAHILGGRIMRYLWENWGNDEGGLRNGEVDLYNVNIPLIEALLEDEGLQICWTQIWRNSYGRLFKVIPQPARSRTVAVSPDSPDVDGADNEESSSIIPPSDIGTLEFKFSPDMQGMVNPPLASLPIGSDAWALHKGWASVTPIRASFAEPPHVSRLVEDIEKRLWRMKL